MKDYYKILYVGEDAAPDNIRRSFRELALRFHPDRNPGDKMAEQRFKEIAEAYAVLIDEDKRKSDIIKDCTGNHIFLGHTRAATVGNRNKIYNNHPFETQDFYMAHNGGIWNHTGLRKEYKIESDVESRFG